MTKLYTSSEIARELGVSAPTVEARFRELGVPPSRSVTGRGGRTRRFWTRVSIEALREDLTVRPGKTGLHRKTPAVAIPGPTLQKLVAQLKDAPEVSGKAPPAAPEVTQAEALLAIATALTKLADVVATLKPTVTESPFKDLKFPTIQPPAIQPVPNLTPKPYSPWDAPAPAPLWTGQPQPKFSLGGVPLDNVPGADNVPQD